MEKQIKGKFFAKSAYHAKKKRIKYMTTAHCFSKPIKKSSVDWKARELAFEARHKTFIKRYY